MRNSGRKSKTRAREKILNYTEERRENEQERARQKRLNYTEKQQENEQERARERRKRNSEEREKEKEVINKGGELVNTSRIPAESSSEIFLL